MKSVKLWLVMGALAAFGSALAQDVKVEKYKLPNGMKVILHEDHSLPLATINTWFYVGSKDEPERRSGFAHLFEHLMFMGTKRVPGSQFDNLMEGAGGSNNASTTEDRTNFYSSGPSSLLPTLLWLDADRLEALGENMTKEKVDLQREVVENERRETTENTPYGKADEVINGLMFPVGHPYHTSVIGSHEDLRAASVDDVKAFFATYYIPNNASLVVAGDFDPKVIKPLIAQLFGTLPRQNDVVRKPVPPIDYHGVHRMTMVDQVQVPKTIFVYHSPAAYKPGDAEMGLVAAVLSDGLNSRLYSRLVDRDEIASDVVAYQDSKYLGSLFHIEVTAEPGVSLDRIEKEVDEEVARLRKDGPTADELRRIKAKLEYATLNGLQSIEEKADKLNEYEFYLGNPNSFKAVLDRYRSATPESVREVAVKVLDPNNRLILRVIPESPAQATNPRDAEPATPVVKPFKVPAPSTFTLSNGLKVTYWHRAELPLMALSTVFNGGADLDPANKAGRTDLAAEMMENGAGDLDSEQFEQAIDELGASIDSRAGHRNLVTSLDSSAANFVPALKLYADVLRRPQFDKDAWTRVKRTSESDLRNSLDDPEYVAQRASTGNYFEEGNPYHRSVSGSLKTLSAISLDDAKAAYHSIVQPQNASIYAAGSLPEAEVKAALESQLGDWKNTAPANPAVVYPPVNPSGLKVLIVDRPGAVQTVIRFQLPGVAYGSPQRIAYDALGTVLGGSFTSRLNHNLREEKGYTYGAGASYSFMPDSGYLVASSSVRADVTGASLKEFLNEMRGIQTGNVSDIEAKKAQALENNATVEEVSNLDSLLQTAISLHQMGLPLSSLDDDSRAIAALTTADLNAVAKSAVDLDRGVLVLVGDKSLILKQIEGLGLPTPTVVDMLP